MMRKFLVHYRGDAPKDGMLLATSFSSKRPIFYHSYLLDRKTACQMFVLTERIELPLHGYKPCALTVTPSQHV
jgi:hypothetical protein